MVYTQKLIWMLRSGRKVQLVLAFDRIDLDLPFAMGDRLHRAVTVVVADHYLENRPRRETAHP